MIDDPDFNASDNDDEDFDKKLELLGDKEFLNGTLEKFKEYMETKIQLVEKNIMKRIKEEWSGIERRITEN